MFGWLHRLRVRLYWLRRRLFAGRGRGDAERGIFWFRDEARWEGWHAVDPAEVVRLMEQAAGEEWGLMFDSVAEPVPAPPPDATDEERAKAGELRKRKEWAGYKLAESVCGPFGVRPFDPRTGKGFTVADRIGLLRDFLVWLHSRAATARDPLATAAAVAPTARN